MESFEARTGQFIAAMVQTCNGDITGRQQVSILIGQMLQDPATAPLARRLAQIVAGERSRTLLTEDLQGEPLMVVSAILDALDDPPP